MPDSDALVLDNIFPEKSWVEVRKGYASHATGMTGAVETLMDYNGPTPKLFAVANGSIFDASSAGAVGAAAVTGLGNNRFQFVNFTNAANTWLIAVNGADGVRTWNGTAWATQTLTGVTAANLFCVTTWKRRVWFGEQGTTKAWYLATDAVSGAANAIDLGGAGVDAFETLPALTRAREIFLSLDEDHIVKLDARKDPQALHESILFHLLHGPLESSAQQLGLDAPPEAPSLRVR
jgi:hypothetical protein